MISPSHHRLDFSLYSGVYRFISSHNSPENALLFSFESTWLKFSSRLGSIFRVNSVQLNLFPTSSMAHGKMTGRIMERAVKCVGVAHNNMCAYEKFDSVWVH